jgi:hypothetical protein
MRKDGIKIIKRINIGIVEKVKSPHEVKRIECEIRINQVKVVKEWVSERNENSRIEKLFSDNNILNWKISTSNLPERTR